MLQIKHRLTGKVLFEKDCASLKLCLEAAASADADLGYADLHNADLGYADLHDADLHNANLRDTYLGGANLRDADLRGTDLNEADLNGADLREHKLTGAPLFIGPIGSEMGTLEAWPTEDGIYLRRGCFFGTVDEFLAAVEKKHGGNEHGSVYRAVVDLVRVKFADKAKGEAA